MLSALFALLVLAFVGVIAVTVIAVMLKLAGQNLAEAEPPAWVRFLFYSHPPISERIRSQESGVRNQARS